MSTENTAEELVTCHYSFVGRYVVSGSVDLPPEKAKKFLQKADSQWNNADDFVEFFLFQTGGSVLDGTIDDWEIEEFEVEGVEVEDSSDEDEDEDDDDYE